MSNQGFLTEEEQVEVIKRWWRNYGPSTIMAVVLALGINFGWRYYRDYKTRKAAEASSIYQMMLANMKGNDEDRAIRNANELKDKYANQPYAVLAAFALAKQKVESKKYEAALTQLQWAMSHAKDKAFKQIARMRAARVMIALGKQADAKKLLATVDDKSFMPMVDEIRKMTKS